MKDKLENTKFYENIKRITDVNMNMEEMHQVYGDFLSTFLPVKRIDLIKMNQEGNILHYFNWVKEGSNSKKITKEQFVKQYSHTLQHVLLHAGDVKTLNEYIMTLDIVNTSESYPILLPMREDNLEEEKVSAFILFVKDKKDGNWSEEEMNILSAQLPLFYGYLKNNIDLLDYIHIVEFMLNQLNSNIYITDIETDKILFMNKAMKEAFHIDDYEDKICWKTLQENQSGRCEFCPLHHLVKKDLPVYVWEETNFLNHRTFKHTDSLIPWIDGRLVHLQQSQDITDMKQMTQFASVDDLTGVWNRRAGKESLERTIQIQKKTKEKVCVALFDINDLKETNDIFGHDHGDILIKEITHAVLSGLKEKEFCFRLSGDEFVVVFVNRTLSNTKKYLLNVLKDLKRVKKQKELPFDLGFCFGVVEISGDRNATEIIHDADELMYTRKKMYHILKAEEKRNLTERLDMPVKEKDFSYDTSLLYTALVQSTDDYLYVCNMKTNTFLYTEKMVEEFDLPGQVIQNAASVWGSKIHENDKKAFLEANQIISDGRSNFHDVEYRALNKKKEWVWLRCRGYVIKDELGDPTLFAGFISKIGNNHNVDYLTGLYSKIDFEDKIKILLKDNPEQSFCVLVLNVDEFKHINSLYNRQFGDAILRIIAQRVHNLLPSNARMYRLDGDEFAIVIQTDDKDNVNKLFEDIQRKFSHQQEYEGKNYYCSLSGGCSIYPNDAKNYSDLYKYAELALEESKRTGKNKLSYYEPRLSFTKTREIDMSEKLRYSVENSFEGFDVFYQPIVNEEHKVMCAEALLRWNCPGYGNVEPDEMIPLLEKTMMIHSVGKWILEEAIKQCKKWLKLKPDLKIHVNISYLQMEEENFYELVMSLLKKYELNPEHLVLELTESYLVKNELMDSFKELREAKVKIAMDDFGTGYSSLGTLKKLPVDLVKIDKAFVRDMTDSRFDVTFIKFIIELCHDVGICACIEGIENMEQYEIVKDLNLCALQGFLFGKPVSNEIFEKFFL